ncbi:MAG TPA: hypothetical protein VHD95_12655 [Rhizomicrobium sp.]|nr:hypothetical protein [Rhizomicrobium sp.]
MVFGLFLALFGIGAFCALIYKTAVYALPAAAGFWCGFAALHSGSGVIIAFAVGAVAGGIVFGIGQSVWNSSLPKYLRYAVVLLFVISAVWAGYCATQQLSALVVPSTVWQLAVATAGAIAVGVTAFMRLTEYGPAGNWHTMRDGHI